MRNSTSSILWILIFSFGLLWVLADVDFFGGITAGPSSLGVVDGEPISLEEYNNRVSFYTDQFNQMQGGPMSAEVRAFYEEQAWEDLVAARLIQGKIEELGITVTDAELINMITGENPDPFIRQQFQAEDGTIDRIALRAAIEARENTEIWFLIEQQLRDNRRQQKMSNFLSAGMRVSSVEVRDEFVRENSFADVRYLRFPYAEISEDEIIIEESDLRNYYRANPDQFQRSETYQFRYVSWDTSPTAQDTAITVQDVEEMRPRFAEAANDSLFLLRNQSQTSYNGTYVSREDLREDFHPVLDLEIGEVSEVFMVDGDPHIIKKIDERNGEIKFAAFSYKVQADVVGTIDRLAEQAREFEFFASEEGFEAEADRRDMEIRSATATKGSNFIPGLGQSQQVLRTLENLRVNRISDPVELEGQIVVLQLLERTPEGTRPFNEVRPQIENLVRVEKRRSMMMDRVRELRATHTTLDDLATASGRSAIETEGVRYGATTIPEGGREPGVIGAIFGLQTGTLSRPIQGQNAVFVIQADNIELADPAQMTDAQRSQIRQRLEQQKFSNFNQVLIAQLKEEASITDNRNFFFR
ncbi:MAG: SurA N-terminal domain-containing protein [Balneolaceae bacterium]